MGNTTAFEKNLNKGKSISKYFNSNPPLFVFMALVSYFVINLISVLHHEPWRDEAQAWLISRDLSFLGIIQQMKYEGHPCLWHLIIMPFAKLSLPLITIDFISLTIMCLAAFLFLKYAPFSIPVKAAYLFCSSFIYYYPVIARSYCLIPLILFLTAMAYKNRMSHPIRYGICLAFLAQTHVIMLGLYGMLAFFFFWEHVFSILAKNTKAKISSILISLFIVLSGFFLLCAQILGSLESNSSVGIHNQTFDPILIVKNLYLSLCNVISACTAITFITGNGEIILSKLIILVLVIAVCLTAWLIYAPKAAVIFTFSFLFQLLIYTFVAGSSGQRSLTFPVIFIFCLWISNWEYVSRATYQPSVFFSGIRLLMKQICLLVLLFLCISSYPDLFKTMKADFKNPYSNGEEAAAYINMNLPSDAIIVCTAEPQSAPVVASLSSPMIWNPVRETYQSFTIWDTMLTHTMSFEEMKNRVERAAKNPDQIYILFSPDSPCMVNDLSAYSNTALTPVATWNNALVYDEKYTLYKMNP